MKVEFARKVYDLVGKTREGRSLRLVVTPEGQTLAVDTEINLKEVPEEVIDTLNHWLKGFQTSTVTRSVREGGARVWYQLDGQSKNGQITAIEIRADGKKVVIEEKERTPMTSVLP